MKTKEEIAKEIYDELSKITLYANWKKEEKVIELILTILKKQNNGSN